MGGWQLLAERLLDLSRHPNTGQCQQTSALSWTPPEHKPSVLLLSGSLFLSDFSYHYFNKTFCSAGSRQGAEH